MVVHTCNPNTEKSEVGGWGVQGQPALHSKILSHKYKTTIKANIIG
jgi:hypothetical protein